MMARARSCSARICSTITSSCALVRSATFDDAAFDEPRLVHQRYRRPETADRIGRGMIRAPEVVARVALIVVAHNCFLH